MVCDRCIMTVEQVLEEMSCHVESVSLGKAEIRENPRNDQLDEIYKKLREKGFELIKQNSQALTEQIKAKLIDYVSYIENEEDPIKLSDYLSGKSTSQLQLFEQPLFKKYQYYNWAVFDSS